MWALNEGHAFGSVPVLPKPKSRAQEAPTICGNVPSLRAQSA